MWKFVIVPLSSVLISENNRKCEAQTLNIFIGVLMNPYHICEQMLIVVRLSFVAFVLCTFISLVYVVVSWMCWEWIHNAVLALICRLAYLSPENRWPNHQNMIFVVFCLEHLLELCHDMSQLSVWLLVYKWLTDVKNVCWIFNSSADIDINSSRNFEHSTTTSTSFLFCCHVVRTYIVGKMGCEVVS